MSMLSGRTQRRGPRRHPHRCDALFQHIAGRVHDPGIDVAEFFERKQVFRVLGAVELIGGGLVDRHRDSVGFVFAVSGVQGQGFRMHFALVHGNSPVDYSDM